MTIEIMPADSVRDAAALSALDARIFSPSDAFEEEDWEDFTAFWIAHDGEKIGSMAFGLDLELSVSAKEETPRSGCLYIATTGILQEYRGQGVGRYVKEWQINWAKSQGFQIISTNCRESNTTILNLNKKFGFLEVGTIPGYHEEPDEATTVLELKL